MGRKTRKDRKAARSARKQVRRDERREKRAARQLDREAKRKNRQQSRRDNQDARRENRQDRRENRRESRAARQEERRNNQDTRRQERRQRREERRENRQDRIDSIFGESDRRNERRANRDQRREDRHQRQDDRRDNRRDRQDDRRSNRAERRENRQQKRDNRLANRRARQDARRQRREDRRETRRPRNVEYWSTLDKEHSFPEQELNEVMTRPNVGIAFSGGGSRSAVASFGTMRALHEMGLDDKFRYIGAISGGAWFTAAYSFLPEELSDDEFFGEYLDFASITDFDQVRDSVDSSAFLRALTYGGIGRKALHGWKGYLNNRDENWSRAVGQSILAPLGLFESLHPMDSQLNPGSENQRRAWDHIKWFTWSDETLDDILQDNPHLEEDDFDIVNRDRPYPVIIGALCASGKNKRQSGDTSHILNQNQKAFEDHFYDEIFGPSGNCDNENLEMNGINLPWQNMSLLEMSPLYTGVRVPSEERGGCYIESFGFDSELRQVRSENEVVVDARFLSRNNDGRSQRFSVSDVMGITGSAMGWLAQGTPGSYKDNSDVKAERGGGLLDLSLIEDLTAPAVVHWQPQDEVIGQDVKKSSNKVSRAVDGGMIDNFGILPLLMRKVEKIVVCMNSSSPIRDVTGEFPEDMMPNFEHFFGVVDRLSESTGWGSRGRNQVFENVPSDSNYPDCIEEILAGLKQNRETHGVSFFSSTYSVIENRNYGIEPYQVEIFWYFTESSEMSDQVLDVLEADYDNIEGYEATIDDYDLHSIFVKDIIHSLCKAADVPLSNIIPSFKSQADAINSAGDSFVTSTIAANSIFGEDWEHILVENIPGIVTVLEEHVIGKEIDIDDIEDMLASNGFPHYNTHMRISLSAEEVGLLANYTHWSFLQLESHLRAFLDGAPTPSGPIIKSSENVSFKRRSMRSPAEMERKKDRIRIRQEDRIDDREFYGDADLELNEDLAFAEEEALLEGKHDTAMNSIRNVRSSGPTQTGVIQLKNAIANQEYSMDISNMAEDPDVDDVMTFSKVRGPSWLIVNQDGEVRGTPTSSDVGTNRFTFRVTDLEGESDDAEIIIEVESGNRPPRWKANLR